MHVKLRVQHEFATTLYKCVLKTSCLCVSGDLTGRLLAYTSLLPVAIIVGFVTLIVFKRELHTVSGAHVRFLWFSHLLVCVMVIQSLPKVLEQQGKSLCFCLH